jgi:hypothetical protein
MAQVKKAQQKEKREQKQKLMCFLCPVPIKAL